MLIIIFQFTINSIKLTYWVSLNTLLWGKESDFLLTGIIFVDQEVLYIARWDLTWRSWPRGDLASDLVVTSRVTSWWPREVTIALKDQFQGYDIWASLLLPHVINYRNFNFVVKVSTRAHFKDNFILIKNKKVNYTSKIVCLGLYKNYITPREGGGLSRVWETH